MRAVSFRQAATNAYRLYRPRGKAKYRPAKPSQTWSDGQKASIVSFPGGDGM